MLMFDPPWRKRVKTYIVHYTIYKEYNERKVHFTYLAQQRSILRWAE